MDLPVQIQVTDEATEGLEGIRNYVIVKRMYKLVARLKNWPNVSGVKRLSGVLAGKYRMRTGDYRLQFRIERRTVAVEKKEVQQTWVIVEKIGHRDGFYDD